ncbi:hypothetical protein [Streptomyces sp. NPDC001816]|uniref:hypothetical protein n=1 Tax=Streptomyces sp. NPDC001816 TaxID=3364612 RepID=UPI0036A91E60
MVSRFSILSEDFAAQVTGAEHTAKRKIVVRGFTGQALQDQIRAVHANAAELTTPFLPRGRLDLVNDFGKPLAVRVTLDVLAWTRRTGSRSPPGTVGSPSSSPASSSPPNADGTAWTAPGNWRPTSFPSYKSAAVTPAGT